MAKSLYSLILSDEVVSRIDRLATRQGMNRSQLVNRILAEYCSMVTPEKRIESVLDAVTRLMDGDGELAPFFTPNQPAMFFKTSLEYRYRPTVRYDLRLRPQPENGSSIWTAPSGVYEMPYSEFVSEVRAFYTAFFEAMDRQVTLALQKDWGDVAVDKAYLAKEQNRAVVFIAQGVVFVGDIHDVGNDFYVTATYIMAEECAPGIRERNNGVAFLQNVRHGAWMLSSKILECTAMNVINHSLSCKFRQDNDDAFTIETAFRRTMNMHYLDFPPYKI